jgi:signal peptidase I
VTTLSDRRASWTALALTCTARLVLGVLAVLLAVSVLPRLAGWETTVVMSGSMAPAVEAGDVVVVRPAAAAAGDIVLADDPDVPGRLRLHRVVAVEDGGLRLRGDANPSPDATLVDPATVHGVGALRLPLLGLPVLWWAEGRTAPLLLTAAGLLGLGLLSVAHRPADRAPRPGRRVRASVPAALVTTVVLLAASPAVPGSSAVFTATTTNPVSSLGSTAGWTCTAAVQGASAAMYLPLQETQGPVATNRGLLGAGGNGTYSATGVTYGVGGPRCGTGAGSAVRFDGVAGQVWASGAISNPQTFTIQTWFATTTTTGGKLIGFGNGTNGGTSSQYDRHVYMADSGQLLFGVYDNQFSTITSPAAYNDGRWHLMTATFSGSTGMRLYVDGGLVASNSGVVSAENSTGYWRIGYDNLGGWPSRPTSDWFAGSLAHVAGFGSVLTDAAVAAQYDVGPWSCATAAGAAGAGAVEYLPLQELTGTVAANQGSAGVAGAGTYSAGGVTYGAAGPSCGPGSASAAQLDGSSGQIWTSRSMVNPQWFTVQIWFATTTTRGGKLIGFGASTNGAQSSRFDRHIYMTNSGSLRFGVYNGTHYTIASPAAYNDGRWHLATATFSPATGMSLYVDGALAASSTVTNAAEVTTGYWRIGYDNLGSWPDAPTSHFFGGSVAHASVYERVLTAEEVAGQYAAGAP